MVFLVFGVVLVSLPVQKVASFTILAAAFDEKGLALFGFVFEVGLLGLSELIDSMCELALVIIATKPSIEKISTQFVFEFFVPVQFTLFIAGVIIRVGS